MNPGVWIVPPQIEDHGEAQRYGPEMTPTPIEDVWNALVSRVERDTAVQSDPSAVIEHFCFGQLRVYGRKIVRLLLSRASFHPSWLLAVKEITGEDPTHPEHRGNLREMIADWEGWLSKEGDGVSA